MTMATSSLRMLPESTLAALLGSRSAQDFSHNLDLQRRRRRALPIRTKTPSITLKDVGSGVT
jgi:hypothetical protein